MTIIAQGSSSPPSSSPSSSMLKLATLDAVFWRIFCQCFLTLSFCVDPTHLRTFEPHSLSLNWGREAFFLSVLSSSSRVTRPCLINSNACSSWKKVSRNRNEGESKDAQWPQPSQDHRWGGRIHQQMWPFSWGGLRTFWGRMDQETVPYPPEMMLSRNNLPKDDALTGLDASGLP